VGLASVSVSSPTSSPISARRNDLNAKMPEGGHGGPPSDQILTGLAEVACYFGEFCRGRAAKGSHGCDTHDGDEGYEKRVLNQAGAALIVDAARDLGGKKLKGGTHFGWTPLLSKFKATWQRTVTLMSVGH
jgi:hypothetical protein